MKIEQIYDIIEKQGFTAQTLQAIDKYIIEIHMQDSARQVRLSLGRPSSRATRQQALQQVAMLKAAKEAQQTGK